ncbi:DUF2922 domain-containing protein [Clostridium hydrogenum]|uniref:DUF2922 domain-containing protein n=1 Tax=Clostridium hydrogenum TaxID=2855764 RepID=UPI001F47A4E5|nr:DUF2922 domain-containing protein [Clostridium hydrogenum]
MAKSLVMNFLTETGKKVALKVPNVKDDVTKDQILSVMNTVISKNIFTTSNGALSKVDSARIDDSTSTAIDLK